MKTLSPEVINALAIIRDGGVVAFPTETYYGLAVDPFNEKAVARLFAIKNRPTVKPLLTLVSGEKQLDMLTPHIPSLYRPLMDLWPCALTLVFQARKTLSPIVTGGTGTVAARISSHPLAQILTANSDCPITATSANISGKLPAVCARDVYTAFGNKIDYVLDGGTTTGGSGSTLVGIQGGELVLLRKGVLEFSRILNTV